MKKQELNIKILFPCFFICAFASDANADPQSFFPSVKIHEDDRLDGEYYLEGRDCSFVLTRYRPNRLGAKAIWISKFDLSYHVTEPELMSYPYASAPHTSRHNVPWVVRNISSSELEKSNAPLRQNRLSFHERRELTSKSAIEKSQALAALLERIKAGEFGKYAAHNQSMFFRIDKKPVIVSASVPRGFVLPVTKSDAHRLIVEVHRYRVKHCGSGKSDEK